MDKKQAKQYKFIKKALESPEKLQIQANDIAKGVAYEYKRRLIQAIKSNKYGYKLAESTIAKRLRLGIKSTTPYIFRGDLIKSLSVKKGQVAVKKGKHYSGYTYEELWFMLEFGRRDKGIPARPVWRPTYEEFLPEVKEIWKKFLDKQFNDK